jgi:periplasmic divalent cation tolerance protein
MPPTSQSGPSGPGASAPLPNLVVALTTEGSTELAEALAQQLLEQRLVACAALQPQRSIYHWQGSLEQSDEVQLLLKTHPARLAELAAAVQHLHSYRTPEWIHWSAGCSEAYGRWLAESCGLSPDGDAPAPADPPGSADQAG